MEKKITPIKAILIFASFTVYFFILLFTLYRFLKANFSINSAAYWFITGYSLFIPLFVVAIIKVKAEGSRAMKHIKQALHIQPFSKKDWKYAIYGLLLTFVLTGVIFAISVLLNKYFGIRNLSITPWFMEMQPFQGSEKLLLLVWLPMFFFNIVGEEILWRGYIQSRLDGKYTWLLCSFLWMLFHLPFGLDLMIMLIPIAIIVPYVFSKTQNSLTGIFIHGIYNGPIFILVSLGIIK